jgi:hypothetical protein
VAYACNLRTWEVEEGRSRFGGQSGLQLDIVSKKEKKKKKPGAVGSCL